MRKTLAITISILLVTGCAMFETTKYKNVSPGQRYHAALFDYNAALNAANTFASGCLEQVRVAATEPACVDYVRKTELVKIETDMQIEASKSLYESGEWSKLESYIPILINAADRIRYYVGR